MIDEQVSIIGEYPQKKPERTHFRRKFKTKKDKWNWIKTNMPDAVEIIYLVREKFGDIESVQIDSPIRRRGNESSP